MTERAREFDLVVIGGGPAGTSGAFAAGQFGKRVALIESSDALGGAGANTGTIPSKTLRESSLLLNGWKTRKLLGVEVQVRRQARLADFTHHAANVSAAMRERLEQRAFETGVERISGRGRFVDPHTIAVTDGAGAMTKVRGSHVLIATGSTPSHPQEYPFEHPRVHDSDDLLEIESMPRVLAVVGAGVIGAEYACTFAALGVEVHIVDGREALMPFLDRDISAALAKAMSANGIHFHWKERVTSCEVGGESEIRLTLSSGATLTATDVLVAAGRTSNTGDLNLAAARLVAGERGLLKVDEHYRTDVSHIYAAGDVIGPPALAATGMEQARVAVCHAFDLLGKETSSLLPTGIYTIPEASMVGETEQALRERGESYIVGRADYAANPRGRIIGDEAGFLKLIFRADDLRLIGVHAIGEQATELVHIGLTAMHCRADAHLFSRICFNYPTLGDLYKYAAYHAMLKKLQRA
jgi:NAD(P) transhydrogenase